MRVLLPFPMLSGCLFAMWLLLNQSVSSGHVMLGALLAVLGGRAMLALQPVGARVRRPGAMARLFLRVVVDIVRSNIAVARIILGPRHSRIESGFVNIPLDLQERHGLAVLACIITSTPGTLWAGFDPTTRILMIHVLDLVDESAWISTIKGRYERLLLEIFE